MFKCDLCTKTFTGKAPHLQHIASAKHKKKVAAANYCQSLLDPESMVTNESQSANGATALPHHLEDVQPSTIEESHAYNCHLCEAICSTQEQYDCHAAGQKHQKKLRQKELESLSPEIETDNFRCSICEISCSGINPYMMHMDGDKHQKNLKKRSRLQSGNPLEIRCDLCKTTVLDPRSYQSHLLSETHRRYAELWDKYLDTLNDVTSRESNNISNTSDTNEEHVRMEDLSTVSNI